VSVCLPCVVYLLVYLACRLKFSATFLRHFAPEPSADLHATRADSLCCFKWNLLLNCDCCTPNYRLQSFLKHTRILYSDVTQPHLQCRNTALSSVTAPDTTQSIRRNSGVYIVCTRRRNDVTRCCGIERQAFMWYTLCKIQNI